jgi:hypothetical protein
MGRRRRRERYDRPGANPDLLAPIEYRKPFSVFEHPTVWTPGGTSSVVGMYDVHGYFPGRRYADVLDARIDQARKPMGVGKTGQFPGRVPGWGPGAMVPGGRPAPVMPPKPKPEERLPDEPDEYIPTKWREGSTPRGASEIQPLFPRPTRKFVPAPWTPSRLKEHAEMDQPIEELEPLGRFARDRRPVRYQGPEQAPAPVILPERKTPAAEPAPPPSAFRQAARVFATGKGTVISPGRMQVQPIPGGVAYPEEFEEQLKGTPFEKPKPEDTFVRTTVADFPGHEHIPDVTLRAQILPKRPGILPEGFHVPVNPRQLHTGLKAAPELSRRYFNKAMQRTGQEIEATRQKFVPPARVLGPVPRDLSKPQKMKEQYAMTSGPAIRNAMLRRIARGFAAYRRRNKERERFQYIARMTAPTRYQMVPDTTGTAGGAIPRERPVPVTSGQAGVIGSSNPLGGGQGAYVSPAQAGAGLRPTGMYGPARYQADDEPRGLQRVTPPEHPATYYTSPYASRQPTPAEVSHAEGLSRTDIMRSRAQVQGRAIPTPPGQPPPAPPMRPGPAAMRQKALQAQRGYRGVPAGTPAPELPPGRPPPEWPRPATGLTEEINKVGAAEERAQMAAWARRVGGLEDVPGQPSGYGMPTVTPEQRQADLRRLDAIKEMHDQQREDINRLRKAYGKPELPPRHRLRESTAPWQPNPKLGAIMQRIAPRKLGELVPEPVTPPGMTNQQRLKALREFQAPMPPAGPPAPPAAGQGAGQGASGKGQGGTGITRGGAGAGGQAARGDRTGVAQGFASVGLGPTRKFAPQMTDEEARQAYIGSHGFGFPKKKGKTREQYAMTPQGVWTNPDPIAASRGGTQMPSGLGMAPQMPQPAPAAGAGRFVPVTGKAGEFMMGQRPGGFIPVTGAPGGRQEGPRIGPERPGAKGGAAGAGEPAPDRPRARTERPTENTAAQMRGQMRAMGGVGPPIPGPRLPGRGNVRPNQWGRGGAGGGGFRGLGNAIPGQRPRPMFRGGRELGPAGQQFWQDVKREQANIEPRLEAQGRAELARRRAAIEERAAPAQEGLGETGAFAAGFGQQAAAGRRGGGAIPRVPPPAGAVPAARPAAPAAPARPAAARPPGEALFGPLAEGFAPPGMVARRAKLRDEYNLKTDQQLQRIDDPLARQILYERADERRRHPFPWTEKAAGKR